MIWEQVSGFFFFKSFVLEKLRKADWRACDSCVGKIADILDSENNVRKRLGGKKSVEGMRNSEDICFLEQETGSEGTTSVLQGLFLILKADTANQSWNVTVGRIFTRQGIRGSYYLIRVGT